MKYRLVISLIALMAPFFCKAQQDNGNNYDTMEVVEYLVPDYDKIGKAIKDKNSEYYYPNLVKMLANADTSITLEQLHYLYYGYVLQDNYDPYLRSDEEEQALDILNKDDVSEKEARKVIKLMDKAVKEYPHSFETLFLSLCCRMYCLWREFKASIRRCVSLCGSYKCNYSVWRWLGL